MSAIDLSFASYLVSLRSPQGVSLMNVISFFGETGVIASFTIIACFALSRSPALRASAYGLATAVLGASTTVYLLKTLIGRARPDGLIPAVVETSGSFPSGHATLAMAFYGFIAYLLCQRFPRYRTLVITLATLLIFMISASRLYLGVHYLSDVVGGALLGGLWLAIGIRIAKRVTYADENGVR